MSHVSEDKLIEAAINLEDEQNFIAAILLGSVAVVICGSLWGMFGYLAGLNVDFLYILVGPVVGYTVREAGKGLDFKYGFLAGFLTCCAIILGEMMIGAVEGALFYKMTPWEAFLNQPLSERWDRYLRSQDLTELGLLIVGIAISVKFSFRKLSNLQAKALSTKRLLG